MNRKKPEQDPRESRKRRRLAVAAGALVLATLAISSCGFEITKSSDSDKSPASTTTQAPLVTSQLRSALLVVADMPPGWSVDPTSSSGSSGGSSSGGTDALCPAGSSAARAGEHEAVETAFTESAIGPFLYQSLFSGPDAESHMAELRTAFDTCVGETWLDDMGAEPMTLSLTEVSAKPVGDSSVAYRLTGTGTSAGDPVTLTADFVLVRNGTVIQLYGGVSAATLGGVQSLSADQFNDIIQTGNDKVERISNEGFRA